MNANKLCNGDSTSTNGTSQSKQRIYNRVVTNGKTDSKRDIYAKDELN